MMKLNLGCGKRILGGYVNVDIVPGEGVDVVADLNKRFPFPDDHAYFILATDFLEHVEDPIFCMKEIHRILKPGGIVEITIPYYNSANAYSLHHKTIFRPDWYKLFLKERGNKNSLDSWDYPAFELLDHTHKPTKRGRFFPFKVFLSYMIGEIIQSTTTRLQK